MGGCYYPGAEDQRTFLFFPFCVSGACTHAQWAPRPGRAPWRRRRRLRGRCTQIGVALRRVGGRGSGEHLLRFFGGRQCSWLEEGKGEGLGGRPYNAIKAFS